MPIRMGKESVTYAIPVQAITAFGNAECRWGYPHKGFWNRNDLPCQNAPSERALKYISILQNLDIVLTSVNWKHKGIKKGPPNGSPCNFKILSIYSIENPSYRISIKSGSFEIRYP